MAHTRRNVNVQVVNYVPKKETGILLFNSLRKNWKKSSRTAAVEGIYHPDGVTFIVDTIQKAVEARTVHLKRQLLSTYEHIYRSPNESMRAFTNRYPRDRWPPPTSEPRACTTVKLAALCL